MSDFVPKPDILYRQNFAAYCLCHPLIADWLIVIEPSSFAYMPSLKLWLLKEKASVDNVYFKELIKKQVILPFNV